MRLNPGAPDYYPSPYSCTYTCYFHVPPRMSPLPFPPFPAKPFPAPQPWQWPWQYKPNLIWVPKETQKPATRFLTASKPSDLHSGSAGTDVQGRTSIMIKNIPNKFTRTILMEILDQHCAMQAKDVNSEFDFVYLPIDFRTGLSKGYAFVNFTTPNCAEKAIEQIHHHKWNAFGSKKIAQICYARIQGKEALADRFKRTQFNCNTDEFLPAIFTPPRNGTTCLPSPDVIGRRITRPHRH